MKHRSIYKNMAILLCACFAVMGVIMIIQAKARQEHYEDNIMIYNDYGEVKYYGGGYVYFR